MQKRTYLSFSQERKFWDQDLVVAGVDEVGRGALAGPIVIGIAVYPPRILRRELRDSKLLTPLSREHIVERILGEALTATGTVSSHEIDEYGLTRGTAIAIERALRIIQIQVDILLIDGVSDFGLQRATKSIIDGDARIPSIAAASIVAKVSRDSLMREFDRKYPPYHFHENKGYGTKAHLTALREYGPCAIHRLSFDPVKHLVDNFATVV